MNTYLSIIIPAYNEERNYQRGALDQVWEYLNKQDYKYELLLVNDGSQDKTLELFQRFAKTHSHVRVINNPHMGKAATVMAGGLAAQGKFIVFSDMDQATPITETKKILDGFSQGNDIVIGSRSGRKGSPILRKILAYGNVIMRSLILRLPYKDTQCGFKGFTNAAAQRIFTLMKQVHPSVVITGPAVNAGFDMELLYLGRKLGLKIAEVPVDWRHQETKRVNFFNDAIRSVKELLLIRFRSLTNAYKLQ